MLALLVLNRSRPVARDELIGALWRDQPAAEPDEALSALLSNVRQAIGRDTVTGGGRRRAAGTLRRSGRAGANRVRFSGRIGRRALRRGRYRLTVRATDGAGNRSAARRAVFRIVR